jgi:hypothetical protein
MRADIHGGPEHSTLQSEAGYIDARPHIRQINETLLPRTAGPYMWVTLRRTQSEDIWSGLPQIATINADIA